MKNKHYILIWIAFLALVAVFIWKDSTSFLSSSAVNYEESTTTFRMKIPPLSGGQMMNPNFMINLTDSTIKANFKECTKFKVIRVEDEEEKKAKNLTYIKTVTFTCFKEEIFIPPTTEPLDTFPT